MAVDAGITAQGQFCLVHVTVKNIGNEARTFTSANQNAYKAAGQKYEADSAAGIYLEGDSHAFLEDINPGNSVNGVVVFDIPKDAKNCMTPRSAAASSSTPDRK
jgi:hypothetical protein